MHAVQCLTLHAYMHTVHAIHKYYTYTIHIHAEHVYIHIYIHTVHMLFLFMHTVLYIMCIPTYTHTYIQYTQTRIQTSVCLGYV